MTLEIVAGTLKDAGMSSSGVYRCLLKEFIGTPYEWGGSGLRGCDCSGSVCAALSYATGKFIRVTADDLYRRVFTKAVPEDENMRDSICAAFFLDETGKAVHVAGYCGLYVNVSKLEKNRRGALRTLEELKAMYPHLKVEVRKLREDYCHG